MSSSHSSHKAYIIDPTYHTIENSPIVFLWCVLDDKRRALIKKPFEPYFFIKKTDEKEAKKLIGAIQVSFEKTDIQSIEQQSLTKIITKVPSDVPKLREAFEKNEIACYEADIRFAYRAMMDWGIHSICSIKGTPSTETGLLIFDNPEILPVAKEFIPELSILSFDIESDKDTGHIFCLSTYGKNNAGTMFQEKFIIAEKKVKDAVTCKDEKELLEKFTEHIKEIDPDIITGWNVIDFDLHLLDERAKKAKVKLFFGRDGSELKLRIESSFFRDSAATIEGRMVLDGIQLLKNNFIKLQDYKLDTAAKKFSEEEKLIQSTGKEKYEEITRLYEQDKQSLLKYNLLDAKLAFDVIMNSGALPLTIKRSLLVGMPMDRVSASIATLDALYLKELRARGYAAPVVGNRSRDDEGLGGFVMQSKPGIYDYVIVCDFKSLYPSIMLTFNIDPLMFRDQKSKKDEFICAPNGACFSREQGIVPGLIKHFWAEREKAKKAGDELARYAIKIHMNSLYGVLASPNCRFFNRKVGNAITSFAQYFIKLTADFIRSKGFEVIYGDTDSLFIHLQAAASEKEAQLVGRELEKDMNAYLKKFIKNEYDLHSYLEMEFEKTFIRFVMPKVRGGEQGAKKRYAGLIMKDGKEEISFTGLEMVRKDWTDLAKEFQYELYRRVFHKEEVAKYVNKFIKDLRAAKHDTQLVYRKSLRKDVAEYTKTTPPHVKAAMKLEKVDSDTIEYVMTMNGPEPIQNRKSKIDYDHYIDKQLKPIADSLLCFYGTSFDEQVSGSSQASLFDY